MNRTWTVSVVTALLLVVLGLPVSAEGEHPAPPNTLTFYGRGEVSSGRIENLREDDGRNLTLSETTQGGGGGLTFTWGEAVEDVVSPMLFHEWNESGCAVSEHYLCVDDLPDAPDNATTDLFAPADVDFDYLTEETWTAPLPGNTTEVSFHFAYRLTATINTRVLFVGLYAYLPWNDTLVRCSQQPTFAFQPSPDYIWWVFVENLSAPSGMSRITPAQWAAGGYHGFTECAYAPQHPPYSWNASLVSNLIVSINVIDPSPPSTLDGVHRITSVAVAGSGIAGLAAEFGFGSAGQYPVRAEWTCTDRDGGPYYIGARNETGTRWLNVTRDADNSTYPDGELCPVAGPSERYHATLTSADGNGNRVFLRMEGGTGIGNLTLDRLMIVLTADFAVSVENFGWLLYLAFMIAGLMIAAWGIHKWRERDG